MEDEKVMMVEVSWTQYSVIHDTVCAGNGVNFKRLPRLTCSHNQ